MLNTILTSLEGDLTGGIEVYGLYVDGVRSGGAVCA
jgi:hypothetical protein